MVPGIRFLNTVVDHSTRTIMMYVVAPTFCVLTGTVSAKTASADTGSTTHAAPGKVEGGSGMARAVLVVRGANAGVGAGVTVVLVDTVVVVVVTVVVAVAFECTTLSTNQNAHVSIYTVGACTKRRSTGMNAVSRGILRALHPLQHHLRLTVLQTSVCLRALYFKM